MELIFYHHHYFDVKNIKLLIIKFTNYAIIWWDQLNLKKKRNKERPIKT
jgi:hypothetical protein